MLKGMFNFTGVNWWTLVGGIGLNFAISMFSSLAGAYFAVNESTALFYEEWGMLLMIIAIFAACGLSGYMIYKMADDVPLKHSFLSSLGAAAPFLAIAVVTLNPIILMLAIVAVAGNLNGGMMAMSRSRHYVPPKQD